MSDYADQALGTERSQDTAYPGLREWAVKDFPVGALRHLADGMPYRGESKKAEIVDWLMKYDPETLAEARRLNSPNRSTT